ncbi:MAG: DivIVA domain-containing protein [Actinomycetota bacterium]|nr:DivIVA domain-containing protein [Actinomycetota bacterium]
MSSMFTTVSRFRPGYSPEEVDAFFAEARAVYEGEVPASLTAQDVREVAFALVNGGYAWDSVDSALDRLEAAFVARERAEFVARQGQDAWMARMAELARSLYPRLTRGDGKRFATAEAFRPGYDKDEVDAFCRRLIAYFDKGQPISSRDVRAVAFRRRRGSAAYVEAPVDAFLSRATEVLLGVE